MCKRLASLSMTRRHVAMSNPDRLFDYYDKFYDIGNDERRARREIHRPQRGTT